LKYSVFLHPSALVSLNKLDRSVKLRIIRRLEKLGSEPESGKRLRMGKFYSLRIGEYRAIYEIWRSQGKVIVLFVDTRQNIYEEFRRLF